MAAPQNVIAVIFDFDDTLTDDSTTLLLKKFNIDADDFWKVRFAKKIEDGWDPTQAYLSMLLENVGKGKPFGQLTNADLRKFGSTLKFYPGIPDVFADLRTEVAKYKINNPQIEFYIISGGLEEVILGSSVAPYINRIYGCRFAEDESGVVCGIKNVISFTEKTRFLYELNKGIGADGADSRVNPYQVNNEKLPSDRRIPLSNMIYVGDGLTDVPCFSVLKEKGLGLGVFDPRRAGKPKQAFQQLLAPKRVTSLNAPEYRELDQLGALLRAAVSAKCQEIELQGRSAV
jgi:2-hydroxy-3-keto-5-methylthiopentenyl-1-phosphate phosphatase